MKRSISFLGLGFMAVLVSFHLACNDNNPNPAKPSTSTASASFSPTPSCGFTLVTLPTVPFLSGGVTLQNEPHAASAPATLFTGPFSYGTTKGFVLRNDADWSAFYGPLVAPAPPVDFTSQMILVVLYQGCFDQVEFLNVCLDPSQVTATLRDFQGGPHCSNISDPGDLVAVSVPNSSLFVTWPVTVY